MRGLPFHRPADPRFDRAMSVQDDLLDPVRPRVAVLGGLNERTRQRVGPILGPQRIGVRLALERAAERIENGQRQQTEERDHEHQNWNAARVSQSRTAPESAGKARKYPVSNPE